MVERSNERQGEDLLSFADDIMVLAEGEEEMRELIKRLEKFESKEVIFKCRKNENNEI